MDTNWEVSPAAAPKLSTQSAKEQKAWLPPVAVGTEVADSPTAAVVAWTQAGVGRGLSMVQSTRDRISMGCC